MNKHIKPVLIGGIGEENYGKQYRQGNRIYDSNYIAMACLASPIGNAGGYSYLYLVEEEMKKDKDIKLPGAYGRTFGCRGKLQELNGICDTLVAAMGTGGGNVPIIEEEEMNKEEITPIVEENNENVTATMKNLRIRKLTPKECFRLQGFDDDSFMRAEKVNSNTQLYKQAGNSIAVPVLCHIFKELFKCGALETD